MSVKSLRKLAESRLSDEDNILHLYTLPNSSLEVDSGNLFYAATEYKKHAKKLSDALLVAAEVIEMQTEAMEMGAFHHQSCDANWYSEEVDEEKVRSGVPDPRKAKHCTCARRKIDEALTKAQEMLEKIE